MRFLPILAAVVLQSAYLVSAGTPAVCFNYCADAHTVLDLIGSREKACKTQDFLGPKLVCHQCCEKYGGDMSGFPEVANACK